jgi:hypothetical protein
MSKTHPFMIIIVLLGKFPTTQAGVGLALSKKSNGQNHARRPRLQKLYLPWEKLASYHNRMQEQVRFSNF